MDMMLFFNLSVTILSRCGKRKECYMGCHSNVPSIWGYHTQGHLTLMIKKYWFWENTSTIQFISSSYSPPRWYCILLRLEQKIQTLMSVLHYSPVIFICSLEHALNVEHLLCVYLLLTCTNSQTGARLRIWESRFKSLIFHRSWLGNLQPVILLSLMNISSV